MAIQQLIGGVKGAIIFDVCARHGHVAGLFRELFLTSAFHAFKHLKSFFERLKANCVPDPIIIVVNHGVIDSNGAQ